MQNLLIQHDWLLAIGLGLMLSIASAQDTPAPGTTSLPAVRPAPGNAGTATQTKPAAPAPKTTDTTPAAPAKKPADTKPATTTAAPSVQAPTTAAEQDKAAETPAEAPKKKAGAEPPPCVVADFRAIGIDTQDSEKRRARALEWVKQRGKQCTAQQLLVLRNNRAQWLGTGDSAAAAAAIDALLERLAVSNPDIALLLYGTPPPPPPPPDPKAKKPPAK